MNAVLHFKRTIESESLIIYIEFSTFLAEGTKICTSVFKMDFWPLSVKSKHQVMYQFTIEIRLLFEFHFYAYLFLITWKYTHGR